MPVYRDLPAKMVVDIALPPGIGNMILTPDHMGHPKEVIICNYREVHQGVDMCLHFGVGRRIENTERREVTHCRIGIVEVGL